MKMTFRKSCFYPPKMLDRDYRRPKKGAEAKIRGKESKTALNNKISIGEMFRKMMRDSAFSSNNPAILQDCKLKMTFKQLNEVSHRLAKHLVTSINNTRGVRPNKDGDIVIALLIDEREELDERLVTFVIACMKVGITFMILDTINNRLEDLEWTFNLVRPVMLVTGNRTPNLDKIMSNLNVKDLPLTYSRLSDIWKEVTLELVTADFNATIPVLNIEDPESWLELPHFERTVGIYFTAGSEGSPQGVRTSSREIFNRIRWQNKVFPIDTKKDAFALSSSLTDPRSLAQIFTPLLSGKSVTLISQNELYNPSDLLDVIAAGRLTRLTLSPPVYSMMLDEAILNIAFGEKLSSITHLTVSGAALSETLARKFFTVFPTALASGKMLIATYGSTELLGEATYEIFQSIDDIVLKSLEGDHDILSVGVPIANTSVIVVDRNDDTVPVGYQGEIMFSGTVVSSALRGYVGQGSGIAAQLNFNDKMLLRGGKKRIYYKTGDYGRILPGPHGANRLYIEGRTDTEKNVDGKPVNFYDIDENVKSTELVTEAVTLVYFRGRESQVVITACVLKEGTTLVKVSKAVRQIPVKKMVHYPVLFAVKRIPFLPNGRVNKKELRNIFRNYVSSCDDSEWSELDLKTFSQDLSTVKVFCTGVGQSIGMSIEEVISKFDQSYWDIGGTPVNAVMTMAFCAHNGLFISLEDFAASAADSLSQVCERFLPVEEGTVPESILQLAKNPNGKFEYRGMLSSDKNDVSLFIAELSYASDTLDVRKYYSNLVEKATVNKLSIVAKSVQSGRILGGAINIPEYHRLSLGKPPEGIAYGLQLIDSCNRDARYQLWRKSNGKIMNMLFLGIDHYAYLQPAETMIVMRDLILQSSIAAVSCGYSTVVVTTSDPLIQEIAVKLLGFESILDRQVCKFKAKDGIRPFAMADDNHLVSVLMKDLSKELKETTMVAIDASSHVASSAVTITTASSHQSHSILTSSINSQASYSFGSVDSNAPAVQAE